MMVDRIEWIVMPDPATAAAALQNGEVDWWELPIPDLVPLLRKNRNVAVDIADPLGNIGSFRMNHLYPPFNDVRARRAVLMAIGQEDYMRAIVGDDDALWKPLPGFFTPGTPLYTEEGGEILKGPPTAQQIPSPPPEERSLPTPDTNAGKDPRDVPTPAMVEEDEVLQASIRAGSVAQIVVAVIAAVGLVYLLKFVMVTVLSSILLAFVLEPFVSRLGRIGIPRAVGALLAVTLVVGLAGGLTYFFYSRAVDFATQLPKYSGKIHSTLADLRAQTSKIEEGTRSVIASPNVGKPPIPVEVREAPGLSGLISAGTGTLGEVLLAISFMPFLVYFMLTWKDHAHSSTVRLFPKEHRLIAHRTVGGYRR